MKKIIILIVLILAITALAACDMEAVVKEVDKVKDVVDNAQDIIEDNAGVLDEIEADDEANDEADVEDEEDEAIVISESVESINDYEDLIYVMKEYFYEGHKKVGYAYKAPHDNVNDLNAFIHSYVIDLYENDYTEFDIENEISFFQDGKYDYKNTYSNKTFMYSKTGNIYKTANREVSKLEYTINVDYNPSEQTIFYDHQRDYVSGEDFEKVAQYYLDDDGALFISYACFNMELNELEQMIIYYDGEDVNLGYSSGISATSLEVVIDLSKTKPNSSEDMFKDTMFDLTIFYDGSDTTVINNK